MVEPAPDVLVHSLLSPAKRREDTVVEILHDILEPIFAEEFEGLTTLVVQNISVEIRPDPAVEFLGVLNDYPAVEVPGGLQVQIGDGYGGEKRRIVKLPPSLGGVWVIG